MILSRALASARADSKPSSIFISTASSSRPSRFTSYHSLSRNYTTSRTMATASKVLLKLELVPQFAVDKLTAESADKASKLLQENHEKHHMYFNDAGFHSMFIFSWSSLGCACFVDNFLYQLDRQSQGYNLLKHQRSYCPPPPLRICPRRVS